MAATDAQKSELRRMCNLVESDTTYTATLLATFIERYPLLDERGEEPYTWDTSTSPPTQDANEDWIATYDLHAAAADVWQERAAALVDQFDFSDGNAKFNLKQKRDAYMERVRYHGARRRPGTIRQFVEPKIDWQSDGDWRVNTYPND